MVCLDLVGCACFTSLWVYYKCLSRCVLFCCFVFQATVVVCARWLLCGFECFRCRLIVALLSGCLLWCDFG